MQYYEIVVGRIHYLVNDYRIDGMQSSQFCIPYFGYAKFSFSNQDEQRFAEVVLRYYKN